MLLFLIAFRSFHLVVFWLFEFFFLDTSVSILGVIKVVHEFSFVHLCPFVHPLATLFSQEWLITSFWLFCMSLGLNKDTKTMGSMFCGVMPKVKGK